MCRQTRDGDIIFIGRKDSVVKVRGYRVDLNEIEEVVLRFNQMKQVKVLSTSEVISAYIVSSETIDLKQLKLHCLTHLPRYAVPNLFHQLESLPLTSNNKVDTHILLKINTSSSPTYKSTKSSNRCVDEKEAKIVKLWSDMFERQIGRDESFFEIGGNSLNAQRMLNQLENIFNTRFSLADLMSNPTIHEIVSLLKEQTHNNTGNQNIIENPKTGLPLSFQQEQMLFLDEISLPGAYNLQLVQFFTKQLDCKRLFDALETLVDKNEILRTRILDLNGEFHQQIESTSTIQRLAIKKISNEDLKKLIIDQSTKRFDLFSSPPLRFQFFDVDNERYCLFLETHHIISDATTTMLIEQQISHVYNGLTLDYPLTTYSHWSIRQKSSKNIAKCENMASELTKELSSIKDSIQLRQKLVKEEQSEIKQFETTISLHKNLQSTPFVWFCTKMAKVFVEEFHQNTLIIGAPVQNRDAKTEKVLGNFLNNLIIPLQYNMKSGFDKNLKLNERVVANSMQYSKLPFSFIASQSNRNQLYDVYG